MYRILTHNNLWVLAILSISTFTLTPHLRSNTDHLRTVFYRNPGWCFTTVCNENMTRFRAVSHRKRSYAAKSSLKIRLSVITDQGGVDEDFVELIKFIFNNISSWFAYWKICCGMDICTIAIHEFGYARLRQVSITDNLNISYCNCLFNDEKN
jgi:hypothetical protein